MAGEEKGRTHQELVKWTLKAIGKRDDARVWSNNTGALKVGDRVVKFGLKGSADILGLTADGKFLAIECKTGNAVLSKYQKNFSAMVHKMGGRFFLVKDDPIAVIEALDDLNLKPIDFSVN